MDQTRARCARRTLRLRYPYLLAAAFIAFGCSLSFDVGPPRGDDADGSLQGDTGTPASDGASAGDGNDSALDGGNKPDTNAPSKPQPPQFIGVSPQSSENADGFAVPKPTGTRQGDLLLASIYVTDQDNVISMPPGWVLIDTHRMADCEGFSAWAYHFYSDSDPSLYLFGIKDARQIETIALVAYRGVDSQAPIGPHAVTDFRWVLGYGPVAHTTERPNETFVMLTANRKASGLWQAPAGMESRMTTRPYVLGVFDEPRPNAGPTGMRTATSEGTASEACGDIVLLSLRAAP